LLFHSCRLLHLRGFSLILVYMRRDFKDIIARLDKLSTESPNSASSELDTLPAFEIVSLINAEDRKTAEIVRGALSEIAEAVEMAADSLRAGGRIIYVGAGTSGRLGVLDASECPPTFGTEPDKVIGIIAGGYDALVRSAEGVEDNTEQARADMVALAIKESDCVIGASASGRTPYTIAALRQAARAGARTALIVCNDVENGAKAEDSAFTSNILISLPVGPEIITGSTRMKSGTVTKMTLNMITTGAMVRLGKTYGNLMVDVQATSDKLSARARKMLMDMFHIPYEQADELLLRARGSVKIAVVMETLQVSRQAAVEALAKSQGFVRKALESALSG
jgi:N-acetylmuramic acid 6-phosphate etherase